MLFSMALLWLFWGRGLFFVLGGRDDLKVARMLIGKNTILGPLLGFVFYVCNEVETHAKRLSFLYPKRLSKQNWKIPRNEKTRRGFLNPMNPYVMSTKPTVHTPSSPIKTPYIFFKFFWRIYGCIWDKLCNVQHALEHHPHLRPWITALPALVNPSWKHGLLNDAHRDIKTHKKYLKTMIIPGNN